MSSRSNGEWMRQEQRPVEDYGAHWTNSWSRRREGGSYREAASTPAQRPRLEISRAMGQAPRGSWRLLQESSLDAAFVVKETDGQASGTGLHCTPDLPPRCAASCKHPATLPAFDTPIADQRTHLSTAATLGVSIGPSNRDRGLSTWGVAASAKTQASKRGIRSASPFLNLASQPFHINVTRVQDYIRSRGPWKIHVCKERVEKRSLW